MRGARKTARATAATATARRVARTTAAATATMLAIGLLAGCATPAADRPLVVATTNILGDVVGELVGDQVEVMTLMRPNADPHSFEISAQEAARIRTADLVVSNGLGLEEGLQQHVDAAAADGVPTVEAGDLIDPLVYADGDAEGLDDPHFWTDPTRMVEVVAGVADALETELGDDVDVTALGSAADRYTAELESLDAEMTTAFAGIPEGQRALVTNHHVFGYLAERYDFDVIGAVVPSGTTLAAPSASDLDDLVTAIDRTGVRAIFADSSQPDRLARVLADEAGVDVAVVDLFTESLSEPGEGAETYLQMMRTNTERIATGLSP